jgi:putative phosphonate catabolism associated alcohol dehydrogenase
MGIRASKVVVFHGPGRPLTIETVPVPALREGEILVRNEYTTLCRSDLHTFSGKRVEKTPTILGHETVGTIAEMGPAAPEKDCRGAQLRLGDRVTWAIYASDPEERLSRRGMPQKARGRSKYGHEQIESDSTLHGGLAEYCVLRRHTPVIRIDTPMPLPLMALINCSVATVAGSLRLAGPVEGETVVIAGVGMLGLIACAMCRCAGAGRIVALDVDDQRLAIATRFGADATVHLNAGGLSVQERLDAATNGESVTVALDYSGVPETMEVLFGLLGIGGNMVLAGATFPQRPLQVNAEQLVRKVQTVRGLHNYNEQDFIAAVEFMEREHGRFPFEGLVHDKFNLDEVNEAFQYAVKSNAYRVGMRIGPGQGFI